MEFQSQFAFIATLVFITISLALLKARSKKTQKLPPGPRKLPFIGNLHQLIGSPPHLTLRDLARKHGPLMHLQLGGVSAIVVSSPATAKEIIKTQDLAFADRAETLIMRIMSYDCADVAFNAYGKYWREMRKIFVQELFNSKRVRSFCSIREDEFSILVETIKSANGKPINLSKLLSSCTISVVCRAAFGKVCTEHKTILELIKEVLALASGFKIVDLFPSHKILHVLEGTQRKLLNIRDKMDKILDKLIIEHRENLSRTGKGSGEAGEEDIVDVLLKTEERGDLQIPFVNNNIKALLFDIFAGGTESSSSTVAWAMSEMMRNPHVLSKAQKEIREAFNGKKKIYETYIQSLKYLKLVIKETLRLHPPGALSFPRQCREKCEIDGYHIPIGTKVFINVWAMGRDPTYWPNPESFIPERFENRPFDFTGADHFEYKPFGGGRRICPGISFGVANVELPLALLLYHFNWQLPDGLSSADLDMTEASGLATGRKYDLHLVSTSYI